MDGARWERIQSLFHAALELETADRSTYLASHCSDDPALIAEVNAMLQQDAESRSLLDGDLSVAAAGLLGGPAPTLASRRFGPYRITRALGKGGAGVVYLATREDLQTEVAIKFLRDAWMSPARRERFALEQRARGSAGLVLH